MKQPSPTDFYLKPNTEFLQQLIDGQDTELRPGRIKAAQAELDELVDQAEKMVKALDALRECLEWAERMGWAEVSVTRCKVLFSSVNWNGPSPCSYIGRDLQMSQTPRAT